MKIKGQKITAVVALGILGISMLGGETAGKEQKETVKTSTVQMNDPEEGEETDEVVWADDELTQSILSQSFVASDTAWQREEISEEYPLMGMKMVLPEELLKRMDDKEVAMLSDAASDSAGEALEYALFTWSKMTEEQKIAEVKAYGTEYTDWVNSLERIGAVGVYSTEAAEKLDELTGCTEHEELGSTEDGKYHYYLSTNPDEDQELTDEIRKIEVGLTEMVPLQQYYDSSSEAANDVDNAGEFETTDIEGNSYTEALFGDYDLTLVNVFATWCGPCVAELPELEKLHQEMAEKGVNVVGFVMDAIGADGSTDAEILEKANVLKERAGVTYPMLVPDSGNLNGRLSGIQAYPETFFVDKEGNIVGETYVGSRSYEDWKEIAEQELAALKGENE